MSKIIQFPKVRKRASGEVFHKLRKGFVATMLDAAVCGDRTKTLIPGDAPLRKPDGKPLTLLNVADASGRIAASLIVGLDDKSITKLYYSDDISKGGLEAVGELIAAKHWQKSYVAGEDKFIYDMLGRVYRMDSPPALLEVNGTLIFENCHGAVLPSILNLRGGLVISNSSVAIAPTNISCDFISVKGSTAPKIADVVRASNVDVTGSRIKKLANIFVASGSASITSCLEPIQPPDVLRTGHLNVDDQSFPCIPHSAIILGKLHRGRNPRNPVTVDCAGNVLAAGDRVVFVREIKHLNGTRLNESIIGRSATVTEIFFDIGPYVGVKVCLGDDPSCDKECIKLQSYMIARCGQEEFARRRTSYDQLLGK